MNTIFPDDVKQFAKLAKLHFILLDDSTMTSQISESKAMKYPTAKRKPQNIKFEHGAQVLNLFFF